MVRWGYGGGNRQDLLKRAAAVLLALLVVGGAMYIRFLPGGAGEPVKLTEFLMDTYVALQIGARYQEEGNLALREMERLEAIFDRYSPGSDVARVNQGAGSWVKVSPELVDLLEQTRSARERGLFQVTVGPLVEAWGFGSPEPIVPDSEALEGALSLVDDSMLEVDIQENRVRLAHPGMSLDVGGVAKGYAVERAADLLRQKGVPWALLDAGGDISVIGSRSDGSPWRVGVQHPRKEGQIAGVAHLQDLAVATSGDYQRYFTYQGQRYHHILDPRTGYPPSAVMSVTVIASDVTLADILSTEAFLMEDGEGIRFLEAIPGVEGIIVDSREQVHVTSGLRDQGRVPWFEPR